MARRYVGKCNINLLEPIGQFGTRRSGGTDHANARYLSTKLNTVTRCLFPKDDNLILEYPNDDSLVEPKILLPIIPLALITVEEKEHIKLKPFYRRFKGSIIEEGDDIKARFRTVGCAEVISDNTIKVTELPIHTWTENYKASIKSDELVKSVEEEEENEDADIKLTIT
ncbi:DNA topoisomerase (ATP-hydrolyzing) [Trifolium repens]|nr:DNA topoisomerase (ATP-hydrolyzing) [Trifolium repens]